jgi:hypothetical protein
LCSHERWIAHFNNGQSNEGQRNLRHLSADRFLAHPPSPSNNGGVARTRPEFALSIVSRRRGNSVAFRSKADIERFWGTVPIAFDT